MARPVRYPEHIEPLVQFVEETAPEHIVARTHDKLVAGTPIRDMLLASALAVVRSSDLPPGHHGGPLHPLAGLHAVRHIATRLPGEFAQDAGHPERRGGQQAHPLAGHGPLHPGPRASRCRSATTSTPRWRRSAPRLAAASSTPAITTSSTCSSGCRRCRCSSICSRSPSPRTSSTITTSCSRSSRGGRSSTSAGSTRSSSAGRRCATSRARRCPRRWTTSTR